MAFPTTGVLDNANRTEDPLSDGGKWSSPIYVGDNTFKADGSHFVSGGGAFPEAYRSDQTYGPDCEVFLTMVTKSVVPHAFFQLGIRLRQENSAFDGYCLQWDLDTDNWILQRADNESLTTLNTGSHSIGNGDKLGLECIGSTITAYLFQSGVWTSIVSFSDATYGAAGHIGMIIDNSGWVLDDFGGGTVVGGGFDPKTVMGPNAQMLAGGMVGKIYV